MQSVRFIAEKAREASRRLGLFSLEAKNQILERIAEKLEENIPLILKANAKDVAAAESKALSAGLKDRLLLNKERLKAIIADVRKIASLKDYVGDVMEKRELANGLFLKRVRVPIGVIGIIYEARPNVTVDAACLCLKSGNAVILKGGSDAANSNKALIKTIQEALKEVSFLEPNSRLQDAVQSLDTSDRNAVKELLNLHGVIDIIIPRGGKGLIEFVRQNSKVPIIETGASVVHTYVHEDADINKAVKIVMNAKLRRVSICNALDVLLLHKACAEKFLKAFAAALPKNSYKANRLQIRADSAAFSILRKVKKPKKFSLNLQKAKEADYDCEFLDYILAIKSVNSLDETLHHIEKHSLKHSEAIITENSVIAERFLKTVDAACVYWNTSTQFSDGGQFGLGAEIGISTQKLHARGPFALEGLTSYKWVVEGNGQLRSA